MKGINSKKYSNIIPVKLVGNRIVKIKEIPSIKIDQFKKKANRSESKVKNKENITSNVQVKKLTEILTSKYINLLEDVKNQKAIIGTVEEKAGEYPNTEPFAHVENTHQNPNNVNLENENDKDALISNSKRVLFQKGDKNKVVYKVLDSNLYLTIYNKIFVPKKFLTKRDLNKITKLQNRFKGIYVREVEQTLNRLKASNCILETMLLLVERAYNHAMKKITFTNLRRTFLDPFNKIDDELKFEDKIYFKLPGGFYNIKQNDNLKKENNIN